MSPRSYTSADVRTLVAAAHANGFRAGLRHIAHLLPMMAPTVPLSTIKQLIDLELRQSGGNDLDLTELERELFRDRSSSTERELEHDD